MKTKKLRQDFDDVEDCCFWGRLGQGEKDFRITEVCINCNLELEKVERNALHTSPVLPETTTTTSQLVTKNIPELVDDDMTAPVCEAVLQPKRTAKRRKWVRKKNGLFGWVSIGSRKK